MQKRLSRLISLVLIFVLSLSLHVSVYGFSGAGSGTAADPYLISTAAQLDEMRNGLSSHYKLMANIDLVGVANWTPVGTSATRFTGSLDGNGYVIKNLKISASTNYKGFFGYIGSGGVVKNVVISNATVSGGTYTGGLAGYISASVTGESMTIEAAAGQSYPVVLTVRDAENIQETTYTVTYDSSRLEVVDFASQTATPDTGVGQIAGAELEILSHADGEIRLKSTRQLADGMSFGGVLTVMKFKAKTSGSTLIMFETDASATPGVPVIKSVSASPGALTGNGGSVMISTTGSYLKQAGSIQLLNQDGQTIPLSGWSNTSGSCSVTLPANGTGVDATYTYTVVLDGAVTAHTATVVVASKKAAVTSVSVSPASLPNTGGIVTVTVNGQNFTLPNTQIQIYDGTAFHNATISSATKATCSVSFPENNTASPQTKTLAVYVNGVSAGQSKTVTIQGKTPDGPVITSAIFDDSEWSERYGGVVKSTIQGFELANLNLKLRVTWDDENGYYEEFIPFSTMSDTSAEASFEWADRPSMEVYFLAQVYMEGNPAGYSFGFLFIPR